MLYWITYGLDWIVMHLFSRTRIIGKENLKDGNAIYVCNHQSAVDLFVMFLVLPHNTHFMAKKEFFAKKLVAWVMKNLQVFPVDRGKVDLVSLKHACGLLEEGKNLCIFPQGTRKQHAKIEKEEMHNGVGMIALRKESAVVPMMFLTKPRLFHKNVLVIGSPMDMTAYQGQRANSELLAKFSEELCDQMNALLLPAVKES